MSDDLEAFAQFEHLRFSRPYAGVLEMVLDPPHKLNAMNWQLHGEISRVWPIVNNDRSTRVCIIRGAGDAFSAGGDMSIVEEAKGNFEAAVRLMEDGSQLVYNMINCEKIIVSAINGAAVAGGLVAALLADISIAGRTAKLVDGHTRIGLAAGDHAPLIWPLLCGMAKAKYYLLTSKSLTGEEAERIGLVSVCVDDKEVVPTARALAEDLANGPELALRWTKYAMNNWLRAAGPIFDAGLTYEILTLFGGEVSEGVRAFKQRRAPVFNTDLRGR